MKNKFLKILFLMVALIGISACGGKESEGNKMKEEINEGVIEGYHFKVTDEITDRIKIQMANGDIMLAVLSNQDAPITIANFKELVSEHFYDGLIFHRVIENFMIQTGDPLGTGTGGSEKNIKGEFSSNGVKNDLSHKRGVLSMARRGGNPDTDETRNSASSQFFIVHQDSAYLDGQYASFGRIFAGLDVVDKIAAVDTDEYDKPLKEQKIKSIRFIEVDKT